MAKSFKKFREDAYDDEWGDDDEHIKSKDRRLEARRDRRKKKVDEKLSVFDEDDMNE